MRERLAVAGSLCAMAALILATDQVIGSCRYALELCCELIIPSLFPFFILSILINRLGVPRYVGVLLGPVSRLLLGVSGLGSTAFIMGLCGGYPLGAAYISDMYRSGSVSREEAERLLGFCNNSGPAFIIGAIGGGVFHNVSAGLFLYGVHALAALLCGMILRGGEGTQAPISQSKPGEPFPTAFTETVKQALVSVLNVCGYVICFTVLVGLLDADGFFSLITGRLSWLSRTELHWMRGLLTGFLEIGSGLGAMRGLSLSPMSLALAAFLCSWGGVSVHFQTMAQLADSGLKGTYHFSGKLISAALAALMAYFGSALIL